MIKFKFYNEKQSFMCKRKNLGTKFLKRLFVKESMSLRNQWLTTQECQEDTWFFNNVVNVKLTEHGRIHKTVHVTDIENLLETDKLEGYIDNAFLII